MAAFISYPACKDSDCIAGQPVIDCGVRFS